MTSSTIAWILFAWVCLWPVAAVVFFLLWMKARNRKKYKLVRVPVDEEEEEDY